MLIIPAIDLKDGHCVRLKQGLMDEADAKREALRAARDPFVLAGCLGRMELVRLREEQAVAFSKEFANAIEQKQIAQQQAERAKYVVQKAEQQKAARISNAAAAEGRHEVRGRPNSKDG